MKEDTNPLKFLEALDGKTRWSSGIAHIAEGLIVFIPVLLLLGFEYACFSVIVWYWSREKVEYEFRIKKKGASTSTVWTRGWFPWEWGFEREPDSFWDWLIPTCLYGSAWIAFVTYKVSNQ